MPKQVVVINDFSGGIAKGYSPENLANNQMERCDNLVADGIGKLSTVPDTETTSTTDVVASLPAYKAKNIHTWATDVNFTVSGQADNVIAPSVTELKTAKRARIVMYWSRFSAFNTVFISGVDNGREGTPVFNWILPLIKGFDSAPNQALGKTVQRIENAINIDEINASTMVPYQSIIPYEWNTHAEMQSFLSGNGTAISVSYDADASGDYASYLWSPSTPTNTDFKVSAVSDSDFWHSNSEYALRTMITFDYYGELDITIASNGSLHKRYPSSGSVVADSLTVNYSDFNDESDNTAVNNFADGPTSNSSIGGETTDSFLYSNPSTDYPNKKAFGQFSEWKYVLANVPTNETATYTLSITYYTDASQNTEVVKTAVHNSEVGESATDINNDLFVKMKDTIDSANPDQAIFYTGMGVGGTILFGQNADTPKPYGIKTVTIVKSNVVTPNSVQPGQKYSNFVVIADEDCQSNVYSLENDNWLTYPIDLRIDTSEATDTEMNYSDTEGYLKVTDTLFYANTKPKWFGFLNFNSLIYINNTFEVSGDYYIDDMAPTPYTQTFTGSHVLSGQYSHEAYHAYDQIFQYSTDDAEIEIDVPAFTTHTPSESGLKLHVDWIDGNHNDFDKLAGQFDKKDLVEFYWSYLYHGGYMSQPEKFRNGTTDNNVARAFNPLADDSAMGLVLAMGSNMINSDGSQDVVNQRLKGIEIWARFANQDANNLYLMIEVDLIKGWKSEAIGDWKPLKSVVNAQSNFNCYMTQYDADANNKVPLSDCNIYRTIPSQTFFSKYGMSWEHPIGFESGGTGWKTSCVYNRQAYYGNVRIKDKNGNVTYYPDGIVKSAKGMYDTVSIDNLIEATINDGDEISCLRVAGNKLMQFKKKSLTIMSVKVLENGESREVIDQTIKYAGVDNENQVCDTPYGVFWASRSGLYIFNGTDLQKLTENAQGSTISKEEWEGFYNDRCHVGYDAYWNQLHICKDTQNNPKTLIYTFNTKAFTESNKMYASDQKTGFINDTEGHLLWGQIGTGSASTTTSSSNNPKTTEQQRSATYAWTESNQ